jgi:1,4-dihydroxy-2-naphthoate octaprenyltransferase
MKQDNQSGIKGLPQRIGTKASAITAVLLIGSAITLLALSDLSLPPVVP